MIIVIADDITGAAEMAGIALRYGLKVVMSDDINIDNNCEVLSVYTNTRSMNKEEAVQLMEDLTKKAMLLQPSLFYKKTDSVLRGHIVAEMKAQMKVMNVEKGLLVPANPSLGRLIKKGKYYVNSELIHQTDFANDPEFPIKTSEVVEIMEKEDVQLHVVSTDELLLQDGISIGEVANNEDILNWAMFEDSSVLLAGGASFFNALLAKRYSGEKQIQRPIELSSPLLLISGTTYQTNVDRIKSYSSLVSYMPISIFLGDDPAGSDFDKWQLDILSILAKYNRAIIAMDNATSKKTDPGLLRRKKAEIIKRIFEKTRIRELLIEGGSTAYSIINSLGWQSFIPTEELQQGIVRMQVKGESDLHLTIKPGSYNWPVEWNFN